MMLRDAQGRFTRAHFPTEKKNNLDAGKAALEVIVEGGTTREGTCSYGIVLENGKRKLHINDACHARMRAPEGEVAIAAFDIIQHEHLNADDVKKWLYFIANESMFKDMILTKDPEYMYKYGVLYDVEKPYSQVVTTAVAIRLATEHPQALATFVHHYDKQCYSPGMLLLLSFCANKESLNVYGYGHSCFSTIASVSETKKWMLQNTLPPCKDKPFYVGGQTYYLYRSMWPSANKWGFPVDKGETLHGLISRLMDRKFRAFGDKAEKAIVNHIDAFIKELEK